MNNIIEIDIENRESLIEKYNKKIVSRDLINYIIDKAFKIDSENNIVLNINNKTNLDARVLIITGLKLEYKKLVMEKRRNNLIQFAYFIIGLLLLVISRLIGNASILKEVFLIGGWVFIWEVLEIELFHDFKNNLRAKKVKQLLKSEIKINE